MSDMPVGPVPSPEPLPSVAPRFDPHMFPSRHRPLWQFILDHNPLFLLSTVLMLLGCYLINSEIDLRAGDHWKVVSLLGVINLYELCIIPLGLLLIRRARGVARDGLWLLLFETLFLVNGTFLNVDPNVWGWSLNGVLFCLACVKAGIVLRGLGIGLGPRTWGFLALQLAIIYGMPIFFWRVQHDGVVSQRAMYGLWWLVGMLPVAYDALARLEVHRGKERRLDIVQQVIRRTYLIGPWVMLVAHLRFSQWAHHSDFTLADTAPVLLGLAVAMGRAMPTSAIVAWRMVLPVAAVLVSLTAPASLRWEIGMGLATLRPALVTAVAMVLTYAWMVSAWATLWAGVVTTTLAIAYLWQEKIFVLLRAVIDGIVYVLTRLAAVIPSTAFGWGVWAITAAFVLLFLGAILALRRHSGEAEGVRPAA